MRGKNHRTVLTRTIVGVAAGKWFKSGPAEIFCFTLVRILVNKSLVLRANWCTDFDSISGILSSPIGYDVFRRRPLAKSLVQVTGWGERLAAKQNQANGKQSHTKCNLRAIEHVLKGKLLLASRHTLYAGRSILLERKGCYLIEATR